MNGRKSKKKQSKVIEAKRDKQAGIERPADRERGGGGGAARETETTSLPRKSVSPRPWQLVRSAGPMADPIFHWRANKSLLAADPNP